MGCLAREIDITQFKQEQKKRIKNPSIHLINKKQKLKSKQKKPKCFVYIVTGDAGFAPNPFYGFCTLANCKPVIRKAAKEGDWIIGLYSQAKNKPQNYRGKLIYAMEVAEKITYNEYWKDKRFLKKKYSKKNSKSKCGDNIYHTDSKGNWIQEKNKYHNGPQAQEADTKGKFVLVSKNFFYLGKECISIRKHIKDSINKSWQQKGQKNTLDKSWRQYKYLDEKSGKLLIKCLEKKYKRSGRHGDPIHYEEDNNKYRTKSSHETRASRGVCRTSTKKIC